VSQGVWADCGVQAGHFEILVHFSPYAASTETPTVLVHKQNFRVKITVALGSFISELHIVLNNLQSR